MQRVERVEELLLRALPADEELDIVDEEQVGLVAVATFEPRPTVVAHGVDEVVGELPRWTRR